MPDTTKEITRWQLDRSPRLLALGLAATLATHRRCLGRIARHRQPRRTTARERFQERLGLTDEQMAAIKEINGRRAAERKQLAQSLRQARVELKEAALNGGDVKAKAAAVTTLVGQMTELHASTLQEISPLLTPEQREAMAKMSPAMHRHHHGARARRRAEVAPGDGFERAGTRRGARMPPSTGPARRSRHARARGTIEPPTETRRCDVRTTATVLGLFVMFALVLTTAIPSEADRRGGGYRGGSHHAGHHGGWAPRRHRPATTIITITGGGTADGGRAASSSARRSCSPRHSRTAIRLPAACRRGAAAGARLRRARSAAVLVLLPERRRVLSERRRVPRRVAQSPRRGSGRIRAHLLRCAPSALAQAYGLAR